MVILRTNLYYENLYMNYMDFSISVSNLIIDFLPIRDWQLLESVPGIYMEFEYLDHLNAVLIRYSV